MTNECSVCQKKFSKHSNLRCHVKKFHPDLLNEVAPNKVFKCSAVCNKCNKTFTMKSNLKQHVLKFHAEEENKLTSSKVYPCEICQKNFSALPPQTAEKTLLIHRKHVRSYDSSDIHHKTELLKLHTGCEYHVFIGNKLRKTRSDIHHKTELLKLHTGCEYHVFIGNKLRKTRSDIHHKTELLKLHTGCEYHVFIGNKLRKTRRNFNQNSDEKV
ncbi:hypothetical protein HUJ04_010154 [Dendroctonus ponderosae]|nr:hypothetical protein HUJ04_010154 [Dendroctonus ponderosae]